MHHHFYPRPPRGGRLAQITPLTRRARHFYPRPPRGGRPRPHEQTARATAISIHALREEGDLAAVAEKQIFGHFYPRPPRGGRLFACAHVRDYSNISIHALREEGDAQTLSPAWRTAYFYPRPPRGGRRITWAYPRKASKNFYPRPPRGGRPTRIELEARDYPFLSTPSARRATWRQGYIQCTNGISIHALREEGDSTRDFWSEHQRQFLSTPSARRATRAEHINKRRRNISIHALREEGDSKNGEKHLRFCFIIKRSAQIWKSLSKNIRKNSCDLHRTA